MSWIAQFKLNDDLATTNVINSQGTDGTLQGGDNTEDISVSGKINEAFHFDGSADYVNIGMQSFSTSEGSICCWFKKDIADPTGNKYIISRNVGGNNAGDISIWNRDSDNKVGIFIQDGANTFNAYSNNAINDTNWHWVLGVWSSSETAIYIDNVKQTDTDTGTDLDAHGTVGFAIGALSNTSVGTESWDGLIDDVRIFSHLLSSVERNFIYNSGSGTENKVAVDLDINETIALSDSWSLITNPEQESLEETITLSDSWEAILNIETDYNNKIISYNPLIYITNTDPANIIEVDITTPESPSPTLHEIIGCKYATDVVLNDTSDYFYIVCAEGKVAKIEKADLSNQSVISTGETDTFENVAVIEQFGLTFTSTDDLNGELVLIDERTTAIGDLRFDVLAWQQTIGDLSFNCINVSNKTIDCNFQVLSWNNTVMNSDFKCITNEIDDITPIGLTDFEVYVDGTILADNDLVLDSISITHTIDEESIAQFTLSRKHDSFDYTLDGNYSQITNQNVVLIKINGVTEFNGHISQLQSTYAESTDQITVSATSTEKQYRFNNIKLSLPGIDERLNLYHVMMESPIVSNPVIDPNDTNPKKYKGVRVSLGHHIKQSFSRWIEFDSFGSIAEDIESGDFNPVQNWSYFWSPTVTKFGNFELGRTSAIYFEYIGTSLGPVSDDLWSLTNARHRKQRQYDNKETRVGTTGVITEGDINNLDLSENTSDLFSSLQSAGYINTSGIIQPQFILNIFDVNDMNIPYGKGIKHSLYDLLDSSVGYYIGEAPYQNISSANGIFESKPYWDDKDDGLYEVIDAGYNYHEYSKKVADLEYEKMTNINGDILPDTSIDITATIDCYYYNNMTLLSRINIDNTTQLDVFNKNNGFPVSIKSITITSGNRKVILHCDNQKSDTELELIDGQYPCKEDYESEESIKFVAQKSDMRTRLDVV